MGTLCRLTGEIRYRQGWFGRLVVQVRESPPNKDMSRWRDATIEDLQDVAANGAAQIDVPVKKFPRLVVK